MVEARAMMSRRRLLKGLAFMPLALGAGLLASAPAEAANDAASAYVQQVAQQLMAVANSGQKGAASRSRFSAVLNRYVNLRGIANLSLGPYQKTISPKDRAELYRLFDDYVAAVFAYYSGEFRGQSLEVKTSSPQGSLTLIESAVVLKGGGKQPVKWRLSGSGGSYRVMDMNIKGIWLTIATKKRFSDVLKRSKGDFQPLFAELRESQTW